MTDRGPLVSLGTPLASGTIGVPRFDREALIVALRTDQPGRSTFPKFLQAPWSAGVVSYDVDFLARMCAYYGAGGEKYVESYRAVETD